MAHEDIAKVLVVEDDAAVARMLRLALRSAGFTVVEAGTGGDALRFLNGEQVDAVVLDLGLPDGLGAAVLDWLRWPSGRTGDGPAWMVISALDKDDATRGYGPLGDHFLAKPFDPWKLVSELKELVGVSRAKARHGAGLNGEQRR